MSDNVGNYTDKKGRLVLYNRADGGGEVAIEKEDVSEVILWLSSFQQGMQLDGDCAGEESPASNESL